MVLKRPTRKRTMKKNQRFTPKVVYRGAEPGREVKWEIWQVAKGNNHVGIVFDNDMGWLGDDEYACYRIGKLSDRTISNFRIFRDRVYHGIRGYDTEINDKIHKRYERRKVVVQYYKKHEKSARC